MKKYVFYFLAFIFIVSSHLLSYANSIHTNLYDNVIRLHIIANSDSKTDQQIKFIVRDRVLEYVHTLLPNSASLKDCKNIILENLDAINQVALQTVQELGYSYTVTSSFGESFFPLKKYGDVSLPSGNYQAIRIVLGEGDGKNWWCVMYPPLCFVDMENGIVPEESKKQLQASLSPDSYEIITSDSDVEIRFKIVDFFNQFHS